MTREWGPPVRTPQERKRRLKAVLPFLAAITTIASVGIYQEEALYDSLDADADRKIARYQQIEDSLQLLAADWPPQNPETNTQVTGIILNDGTICTVEFETYGHRLFGAINVQARIVDTGTCPIKDRHK